MSLQPEKEKDLEVKIVPEGTFAGQIDKPVLVKRGEVIPRDTGSRRRTKLINSSDEGASVHRNSAQP
jgi:hypothetical protein